MLRRMLTVGLKLGLLVGVVGVVAQLLQRREDARHRPSPAPWAPIDDGDDQRPPAPVPATDERVLPASQDEVRQATLATEHEAASVQHGLATAPTEAAGRGADLPTAVEPTPVEPEPEPAGERWAAPNDGACPASHPVKVKLRSGVFHLPGMAHYDRTNADRCYLDPAAAEADGFRRAKR